MSTGRICKRRVDLAEAGETARVAAERMRQRGVGTLVVTDREKRPVGILTDRDLALRVLAAGRDGGATLVREMMTPDPKVATEETPIEDALARMKSGAFRRLPVVDGAGRLVGIVTLDDVLVLLSEEFAAIGTLLGREDPSHLGEE